MAAAFKESVCFAQSLSSLKQDVNAIASDTASKEQEEAAAAAKDEETKKEQAECASVVAKCRQAMKAKLVLDGSLADLKAKFCCNE